jgi:hypothetical protein
MNAWGFTPALFPELRARFRKFIETTRHSKDISSEFFLPIAVQGMIDDRACRVRVLHHGGRWCGITFPEDRQRTRDFIAERVADGEYPKRLWDEVS